MVLYLSLIHIYAELVEDAVAAAKRLAGERPTILVTHDRTAADLLGWPVREV